MAHEINVTTSDYAQAFFKSDDKEKSREPQSGRSEFRVRQVALDLGVGAHNDSAESSGSAAVGGRGAFTDHNRGTKKLAGALLFVLFVRGLTVDTILLSARSL